MTVPTARAGLPARPARVAGPALVPAVLAVLAAVVAVVVVTRDGAWALAAVDEAPVDLAVALTYPVAGVLVLGGPRSARWLGWLLIGVGLASGATALATAVAATATSATPVATVAAWLQSWLWVPGFAPLLTLLPLLYPDGRLPSPRWRAAAVAGGAGIALATMGVALFPEDFVGRVTLAKPFSSEPAARALVPVAFALLLPALLAGLAGLVVRLRRSQGLERRQVVVFLAAAGVLVVEAVSHSWLPVAVTAVTQPVAVALLPLAVAVAVTRHRLYDLDLAVLRALVAVSLAGCLAGAYLTLFFLTRAVLGGQTAVATAVAAGLTGLLVQPLAVRLSRAGDRLYYGDRSDPYALLSGLASRLRDGVAPADVPAAVCSAVVDGLRLGAAEVALGDPGDEHVVAAAGTASGPTVEFPLRHRGAAVGRLTVVPRAGERALDPRDRELVAALADQAAPALSALSLADALQRSREALVQSREEERRRLRRDLHDGVGAALAGARLQLDAARDLVEHPTAVRMLDAAGSALAEAVEDVRRLTDDLRPPALDELGLGTSLQALGDRVATPALVVRVAVPALPPLPAALEVAVYRIAAEALNNAARHARATTVRLRLELSDRTLVLEVADDGGGLVPAQRTDSRHGLGLVSMRQRAEELGGTLEVDSGPGGTTVRALLPTGALVTGGAA